MGRISPEAYAINSHAAEAMADRGVTEAQIREVLLDPGQRVPGHQRGGCGKDHYGYRGANQKPFHVFLTACRKTLISSPGVHAWGNEGRTYSKAPLMGLKNSPRFANPYSGKTSTIIFNDTRMNCHLGSFSNPHKLCVLV